MSEWKCDRLYGPRWREIFGVVPPTTYQVIVYRTMHCQDWHCLKYSDKNLEVCKAAIFQMKLPMLDYFYNQTEKGKMNFYFRNKEDAFVFRLKTGG